MKLDICDATRVEAKGLVAGLLIRYTHAFHPEGKKMGQAKVEPFRIVLKPGVEPIYRKQWRLADDEKKFIDEESTKMLGRP